jgi:hypothetical protein
MNNPNSNAVGATPATGATPGNAATTPNPDASGATPAAGATPSQDAQPSFDSWLASQDETTKGLVTSRFSTLESTLSTERNERKELAKQLKKMTGDLDANSEAAQKLTTLTSELESAQRRAEFVEAAALAGCTNPKLAYLAAQADDLKTIDQVKAAYPALFATLRPPATNAGQGARQPPGGAATMNDMIRRAAGRT